MNCLVCKGACCETFTLEPFVVRITSRDYREWLEFHTNQESSYGELSFECRCRKLSSEGLCSVYDTRPIMCMVFPPGGPDCIKVVKQRRTQEEYLKIRDEGDPL